MFFLVLILSLASVHVTEGSLRTLTQSNIEKLLAAHNNARANVVPAAKTPLPSLVWDNALANFAAENVKTCVFSHKGQANGENIAGATSRYYPEDGWEQKAVAQWVSEASGFDIYQQTCNISNCYHYQQVVWAKTLKVGCARYDDCPNFPQTFISCQYDPMVGVGPYDPVTPEQAQAQAQAASASCSRQAAAPTASGTGTVTKPAAPSSSGTGTVTKPAAPSSSGTGTVTKPAAPSATPSTTATKIPPPPSATGTASKSPLPSNSNTASLSPKPPSPSSSVTAAATPSPSSSPPPPPPSNSGTASTSILPSQSSSPRSASTTQRLSPSVTPSSTRQISIIEPTSSATPQPIQLEEPTFEASSGGDGDDGEGEQGQVEEETPSTVVAPGEPSSKVSILKSLEVSSSAKRAREDCLDKCTLSYLACRRKPRNCKAAQKLCRSKCPKL